jgi:hypothetical protein
MDFDLSGLGSLEDDLGVIWSDFLFPRTTSPVWPPFITAFRETSRREIDMGRICLSACCTLLASLGGIKRTPATIESLLTRAVAVALIEPLLDL